MADTSNFDFSDFFNTVLKNSNGFPSYPSSATASTPSENDMADDDGCDEGNPWRERYEVLRSDFQSYKSRVEKSLDIERRNLRREMLKQMLEMVDYIMTVMEGKKGSNCYRTEDRMMVEKILYILKSRFNVVPMPNLMGKPFDPKFHDAICVDRNVDESDVGKIVHVYSDGYMEDDGGEDGVIFHAKVCVGA